MGEIVYDINTTTREDLFNFIDQVDGLLIPSLSKRVRIVDYASKIFQFATRFEAWCEDELVGLLAVYANTGKNAYLTLLVVLADYQSFGIASHLLDSFIVFLKDNEYDNVSLAVRTGNLKAIALYKKKGFVVSDKIEEQYVMTLNLKK